MSPALFFSHVYFNGFLLHLFFFLFPISVLLLPSFLPSCLPSFPFLWKSIHQFQQTRKIGGGTIVTDYPTKKQHLDWHVNLLSTKRFKSTPSTSTWLQLIHTFQGICRSTWQYKMTTADKSHDCPCKSIPKNWEIKDRNSGFSLLRSCSSCALGREQRSWISKAFTE